jgi:hypothetical protein
MWCAHQRCRVGAIHFPRNTNVSNWLGIEPKMHLEGWKDRWADLRNTHAMSRACGAEEKKGRKRIVRFEMHALEVAGGENAELDVTVMMLKEKRDRVETEIDTNPPAQFS